MQQINQILFILFALIMLGVLAGTINTNKDEYHPYIGYWRASIILRAGAFVAWALAPTFGGAITTVANFCFIASGVTLCLVFRSLHTNISKALFNYLLILLLIFIVGFEFIRQGENSYAARLAITGFTDTLLTFWQLIELAFLLKRDKSLGLRIMCAVIFAQFALTMLFIVSAVINIDPNVTQLAQERAVLNLWAGVSSHLITFIVISSYLYQRTVENERRTLKDLISKTTQLDVTKKEKDEIAQLLEEKQALIGSLIVAKKSAEAGALSASIAHELNQPLGAIQLNVQFLQSKLDSNSIDFPLFKKLVSNIGEDNRRAATVVSTLRKVFNQNELETKPIYINDLIESMMPILLPHARDHQIQIKLELDSKFLVDVSVNEFQQVLFNLINNAVDELMGLQLSEKVIVIQTKDDNDFVKLLISDNGNGIPEVYRPSIFDLMKSNKQAGMGLGLWLTRHIVERHRGKIAYLQAPMGGAQFEISLPKSEV